MSSEQSKELWMKTSLDYVRWAREQAPLRSLKRTEAQILNQLASYANGRGECFPNVDTLAAGAVLSKRQTERALSTLSRKGLVETTPRGPGRTARRRLCPDAPLPAPPCPRGTPAMFDAALAPVCAPPAPPDPPSRAVDPPSERRVLNDAPARKEHSEETEVGRARREHVLQPHLDKVLEILEAAPGLLVEPMAVNSALAAYPEAVGHDHVRAAHVVASWAFEGGLHNGTANRQLMSALRKQAPPTVALRHEARARRAAPAAKPPKPWAGALAPVVEEIRRREGEALARRQAAGMQT